MSRINHEDNHRTYTLLSVQAVTTSPGKCRASIHDAEWIYPRPESIPAINCTAAFTCKSGRWWYWVMQRTCQYIHRPEIAGRSGRQIPAEWKLPRYREQLCLLIWSRRGHLKQVNSIEVCRPAPKCQEGEVWWFPMQYGRGDYRSCAVATLERAAQRDHRRQLIDAGSRHEAQPQTWK